MKATTLLENAHLAVFARLARACHYPMATVFLNDSERLEECLPACHNYPYSLAFLHRFSTLPIGSLYYLHRYYGSLSNEFMIKAWQWWQSRVGIGKFAWQGSGNLWQAGNRRDGPHQNPNPN